MASACRPRTPRRWRRAARPKAAISRPDLGLRPARQGQGPARRLFGTHNYEIGVNLAKMAQKIKPKGGTICIQSGGAAAANHNERMMGIRDTLAGQRAGTAGHQADRPERLDGSRRLSALHQRRLRGRHAADGGHHGQVSRARRLHPDRRLPEFLGQAYKKTAEKFKDKIASGKLALPSPTRCRSDRR